MTDNLEPILLVLVGTLAGFLNVSAGGGSLLSLPLLIFLGLPPSVANGTNRIAILVQNIFATARFHHFRAIPKGVAGVSALPAILGSVVGAQVAIDLDPLLFKKLLAVVMVLILPVMLIRSAAGPEQSVPEITRRKQTLLALAFFGIGFYGGFIQAGIGFLIIAVLTFAGFDLVKTNVLKVLIILIFSPFALMVFVLSDEIDFVRGFTLATGNAVGGWLATKVVLGKGESFLRWLLAITVVAFAVRLFWG